MIAKLRNLTFNERAAALVFLVFLASSYATGSNPFQEYMDSAEVPEWLTVGAEITPDFLPKDEAAGLPFRDPAGGVKVFGGTHVEIENERLQLKLDEEHPRAYGASLNPEKTRLILQTSPKPFWVDVKIDVGGVVLNSKERHPLPAFSYGDTPRFYVSSWIWLTDTVAVSDGTIQTKDQRTTAKAGLFVFDTESKIIRQINVKGIPVAKEPGIEVTGVAPEQRVVRISVSDNTSLNGREYFVRIPDMEAN